jgi:hypothetical protein
MDVLSRMFSTATPRGMLKTSRGPAPVREQSAPCDARYETAFTVY